MDLVLDHDLFVDEFNDLGVIFGYLLKNVLKHLVVVGASSRPEFDSD